jgi:hypothetical protein
MHKATEYEANLIEMKEQFTITVWEFNTPLWTIYTTTQQMRQDGCKWNQ